jgi:hypothetical protein
VLGVLVGGVDDGSMSARRAVMVGTAGVVAVLAVVFVVLRWDAANKIAVLMTALAAVAAVGVALWAGLPGVKSGGRVRVSRTGRAIAGPGGRANSGISGPADSLPDDLQLNRTGDADAFNGGDANTGIQLN